MKTNKHNLLATLLTLVALFVGRQAFATITETISFKGKEYNGYSYQIESHWFTSNYGPATGNSHTFSDAHFNGVYNNINFDMTLNGTLNFKSIDTYSDVLTSGGSFTVTLSSHQNTPMWFYGAAVKELDDTNVSGCTISISSDNHSLTITIPSGKFFGKIEFDYVPNAPMTNSNTTVTVPAGDYWVSDANHLPTPAPTVVYRGTTLTQGDDYTLSWSNNTSAGTGIVTATGTGNYAGSVSVGFQIHWATYTVRFNANGGSGEMSDQDFTYNTAQNLTANTFSRTGYSFNGWSTTPNGAVTYTDGQSVSNLTAEDGETITLYAKWTLNTYNITYDLDDGSVATANPATYDVTTPTFTLNNPTKTGYTFAGWTGTDLTQPTQTATITQGSTGDRSYTAHWTPNTYTVHFDANNGEGTMNDMSFTYDQAQNLTANAFSRTYYDFAGWSTSVNGAVEYADGQLVNNLTPINNETVTLYAKWNAINYNITYDLDGGSVATANPTTYNVETPTFTLNNPIKPGYTFDGWTGTDLTEATQTVTITQGSTGDRSYTAHWTPNTYTVHFDANNGEGTMNDMSFTYDQAQNLTANTFTREYHNFSGWNTSANGSGTSYTDGQSVSNLTTEPNGTVTLYAQWTIIYWQGSGTEDDPYVISTTFGLDHLASEVNGGNDYSGKFFKLGADIEYDPNNLTIDGDGDSTNDSNYTAIGGYHDGSNKVFKGNFDGQGYTVSGIRIYKNPNQTNDANHYQGLFGNIYGATVKNITLADANITGNYYIGGIVGYEQQLSTVKNCHAIAVSISGYNNVGGIVGKVNTYSSVDSCQVSHSTINGSKFYVGGIAGHVGENKNSRCYITNCNVNDNTVINGGEDVGGIVGRIDDESNVVENCQVANITVAVTSNEYRGRSGGIVGYNKGITRYCTAIDVTVSGYNNAGGIVGYNADKGSTQYCMVNGVTVSATGDNVGGIVGYNADKCYIQYCTARGITVSGNNYVGGIMGSNKYYIQYCTVNGATISATGDYVGGVVGHHNNSGTIQYCMVNNATLSGSNSVGSILGYNSYTEGPKNNYYHNCKVNGTTNATNVGCGSFNSSSTPSDIALKDGAVYAVIRMVEGYGESTASDHWTFISSPITDNTSATDVINLVNTTTPENYDFYKLVNTTWANYKEGGTLASGFSLENGQGYLYANKDNVGLVFKGTYNSESTQDVTLQQGWNLVGNPLTDSAYINTPFYKMNAAGTGIEAVSEYWNNKLAVCTGVVVQAANAGNVTFSKTAPDHSTGNNGLIQMTLAQTVTTRDGCNTETLDNAIITFNEGSQLGKFYFGEQNANIYIPQDGKDYAIVSVGGHTRCVPTEIPVYFKAKKNGEYTLTVTIDNNVIARSAATKQPEGSSTEGRKSIHLIDNLTGNDVDLLQTPSYTFTARNDDYPSRFKLVFDNENDNQNEAEDFAFISNGEIIVNSEGTLQVIDVLGRIIDSRDAARHVSTAGMAPGVYVLRLINGDNVKTQKIVIR